MVQVIKTTFQLRRGLLEAWEKNNPILAKGEPSFVIDKNALKIGDGVTPWKELEYIGLNQAGDDYVLTDADKAEIAGIAAGMVEVPEVNIVPSDWNAPEGEPGHILNRTHWTEDDRVELLPECNPIYDEGEGTFFIRGAIPFVVGEEITVNWNGTPYKCLTYAFVPNEETGEFVAFGNSEALTNVFGLAVEANDAPFIFLSNALQSVTMVLPLDDSTEVTVSILGNGETVHKLDNKYLDLDWIPVLRYKKGEKVVSERSGNIYGLGFTWLGQEVPYDLTPGNHYYVVWNGDAYHVRLIPGDGEFIFGKFITEAFTISYMYDESEADSLRYGFRCIPLDGSTKVTLSIYESVVIPNTMPEEFLPDNIGGINITGASIGQIARISAVDAEGKPTEWEPIDLPDSGGNVDQGGLSTEATNLLIELLEAATYNTDVSGKIASLREAFASGGSGGGGAVEPDDPTGELLKFDLIEGNVTVGSTYVKYWANIDGSQTKRMEMNPALVRHNSDYQYTAKLTPNADYYMHPHWLTFDNTEDFMVDGTKNVVWAGTPAVIGEQQIYGGEFVIPVCDVFFIHLTRKDKANLTDDDKNWLRNNFTVERVKV